MKKESFKKLNRSLQYIVIFILSTSCALTKNPPPKHYEAIGKLLFKNNIRCTTFLSSSDKVVTSGHCITGAIIDKTYQVTDGELELYLLDENLDIKDIEIEFKTINGDIVKRKSSLALSASFTEIIDFAILELDEPINNIKPLKQSKYAIALNTKAVGYPEGSITQKQTSREKRVLKHVPKLVPEISQSVTLDGKKGYSGSPLLNEQDEYLGVFSYFDSIDGHSTFYFTKVFLNMDTREFIYLKMLEAFYYYVDKKDEAHISIHDYSPDKANENNVFNISTLALLNLGDERPLTFIGKSDLFSKRTQKMARDYLEKHYEFQKLQKKQ